MSSLVRRIQRAQKRQGYKGDIGRQLGMKNSKADDLLARQKREKKRAGLL
jgi:hypothetical protein